MSERSDRILAELVRIAADAGPALRPAAHHELLQSITDAARRLFGAAACSLALVDEEREEIVFHVASGAGAEDVVGLRIPAGSGIAGWVVMSGQPIAIDDVRRDSRFAAGFAASTGYVPTTILAMPLETDRRMLGVIEVLDRGGGDRGGADDMELLAIFAHQAALAVESAGVFSDMGRALLEAVALAERESLEMTAALHRLAEDAPGPHPGAQALAAAFAEVAAMGEEERALALRILTEVGRYATRARRRR